MQDQEAPPIPPRKSMNISNDFSRPVKPPLPVPNKTEFYQTSEQGTSPKSITSAQDESFDVGDEDEEDPICGPAETITGKLFKLWCIN